MTYWIDSHCHINSEEFKDDLDSYFIKMQENSVGKINIICLNQQEFNYSLQIQKKYPTICDISFGFYPCDYQKVTEDDFAALESAIVNKQIVALGEIGLDYCDKDTDKEKQKELFIRQILLANKYNIPIIVHSRQCPLDTYDILKRYSKTKVLLHCFSESKEMMQAYFKLGYYISFSGVVTFNNAKTVKENASIAYLDRIMVETDCPYMTPVPFRGEKNQPAYVKYTGEYVASLNGMAPTFLQQILMDNYRRFFYEK